MLSNLEWSFIRRHTLIPALSALVMGIALVASLWVRAEEQAMYEQFDSNQLAMHQDIDSLVYRRRLVDRYHRRYERFFNLGFVGEERRLDWIETMRQTSIDLTLPRVSYAIEPQLNVVAPVESILAGDTIQIHLSRLRLEAGLLHEVDLLRFIDELQRNAPGLIKIDRCTMTWQGDNDNRLAIGANILADCDVQIFSVVTADVTTMASAL
ncbi:MAG: hypothetical protein AAF351_10005 [Pseudomonadota bacterium]